MTRFFLKAIRRYMFACTVIVTVVGAHKINPFVAWVWNFLVPRWDGPIVESGRDIAVMWGIIIVVMTLLVGVVITLNKLAALLFNEEETS